MSSETGQRRRGIAAAIGCISIVGLMTGLTWPLLSLILDHEGVDPKLIGLSSATQSASLFLVSPLAPLLITRLGYVRTIYLCIALAVTMLLLLPLFPNVYAWFPIRFLLGSATTTIFIAGETWIVQATTGGKRGRVIGVFGFLWAGSFAAGPLIINATGIEGWPPFLAGVAIVLLASLTLPFAHAGAPKIERTSTGGIGRLLRLAPATLTSMIMLGWMGSLAGITAGDLALVRHPSAIYYRMEGLANRIYGDAVRSYYTPLVNEIQCQINSRIEQYRENS